MIDIKAINRRESVKLWAILNGKYDEYVRVYASKNSPLRNYWENVIEPEVQHFCGDAWGYNPRLTTHPIGKAIYTKYGYNI
jgi:hypothetical protein